MKKKIVFMVITMNIGGTEKALLNMIAEIPKGKYDITILMLEEQGGFLDCIPDGVRVKYVENYKDIKAMLNHPPQETICRLVKNRKWLKAFNVTYFYLLSKITKDKGVFFKYVLRDWHGFETKYDIAVAYAGPMDFISYFVANKITAVKKIQWIHFDITKIGFDRYFAAKVYRKFNHIMVVSKEGESKFIHMFPNLKEKTDTFLNITSPELVVKSANNGKGFEDGFTGIRILTVGRLSKEKGQDLTISVLAKLKASGYNVRWYSIGEGSARTEYEKHIKEYHLEKDYILLGANPNPYPFMEQCDIYVQSSRHEGYCITLAEARCFNNPIISTNFTGASEQIIHNQTGIIVNFDEKQLYEAIKKILGDERLKRRIKKNLLEGSIETTQEMKKLYKIVDSINN
ncbi:glycosyltransferase [Bacillus cereus]|uniref:Glycosyl transferase family 1 domain-containing protein n=1 Tax=Bacillus cereus HuA4-10 TaxID=1053206 RepID=J8DZG3_BACCE|nr:glycosyltransferase [Bacillus cereus]EJQ81630.1 hypothetical protein IGC_01869 [Bacillus cereus HuA4-10]